MIWSFTWAFGIVFLMKIIIFPSNVFSAGQQQIRKSHPDRIYQQVVQDWIHPLVVSYRILLIPFGLDSLLPFTSKALCVAVTPITFGVPVTALLTVTHNHISWFEFWVGDSGSEQVHRKVCPISTAGNVAGGRQCMVGSLDLYVDIIFGDVNRTYLTLCECKQYNCNFFTDRKQSRPVL